GIPAMDRIQSFVYRLFAALVSGDSRRGLALLAGTVLLLTAAAEICAQQTPTLVPVGATLKADDLSTAMSQAQQDSTLPADVKAKVVDLYKQALDELHMADEWTAKGKAYKKEADDAPHALELIKAHFFFNNAETTEKMLSESSLEKLKQGLTQAEV